MGNKRELEELEGKLMGNKWEIEAKLMGNKLESKGNKGK